HIEQGPILRAAGVDMGVVTGVQAISWQELTILGKSAHAGTTPMRLRKDPSVAAARVLLEMNAMATSGRYGPEMRATMGGFDPHPGLVNIVPARVRCTVDLRNPDDAQMTAAERDLAAFLRRVEQETGVTIEARQTARTERVAFAADVQAVIASKMKSKGYTFQHIMSGAGHDAQEMAAL